MLSAFQLAASVAPRRSPKEVLQNVKIEVTEEERVTLMATDMDAGIRIDVEGVDVQSPGRALLNVQRVGNFCASPATIKLYMETSDTSLLIRGLQSEFNLPSGNPDEFPTVSRLKIQLCRITGPFVS